MLCSLPRFVVDVLLLLPLCTASKVVTDYDAILNDDSINCVVELMGGVTDAKEVRSTRTLFVSSERFPDDFVLVLYCSCTRLFFSFLLSWCFVVAYVYLVRVYIPGIYVFFIFFRRFFLFCSLVGGCAAGVPRPSRPLGI